MYVHKRTCRGQRKTLGIYIYYWFPFYSLGALSFPEPEALHFASLVCQRALRTLLSLFFTAGVMGTGWHSQLLCGCWGLEPRSSCLHRIYSVHWPVSTDIFQMFLRVENISLIYSKDAS